MNRFNRRRGRKVPGAFRATRDVPLALSLSICTGSGRRGTQIRGCPSGLRPPSLCRCAKRPVALILRDWWAFESHKPTALAPGPPLANTGLQFLTFEGNLV